MDPCGFDTLGIPLELRIKLLDRQIVYPGALPRDVDILNPEKNTMLSFGALLRSVLGTTSVVDGLIGTQTTVPSLSINIGQGSITSLQNVDNTAFGSLAADTTDTIVKQGFNLTTTVLTLTAPTTVGWSQNYLIEATFAESDTGSTVLPYVDAALPSSPFNGPANAGTSQNTQRIQRVSLQALAGVAAATGTQTTPAVTAGWVPLYVVTVAYGQTAITTAQIVQASGAPFVDPLQVGRGIQPGRLLNIQTFATAGTFTYVSTAGTNHCRVTVVAGGASGGGAAANTSGQVAYGGGGGAGGAAAGYYPVASLSGQTITVGAGGAAASGTGNSGNSSSVGSVISASGGAGASAGFAGSPPSCAAPGVGGMGVGGNIFNTVGGPGSPGLGIAVSNAVAGSGGVSILAPGISGPFSTVAVGNNGVGPGCGGSGAASQNGGAAKASGAGSTGIVIIEEFA